MVAAPGNFFYTHSYALAYSEPVLVTGLQADYKLSDHWNLLAGFNNGYMAFEGINDKLDFLGGKWHNNDPRQLVLNDGRRPQDPRAPTNNSITRWSSSSNSAKSCSMPSSKSWAARTAIRGTHGYATWYGLDQYLFYTINPRWSVGSRVEWFRDQDGWRSGGRRQHEMTVGWGPRASTGPLPRPPSA